MTRIVVLSTCGTQREARKIANDIVHKRMAACVNILKVDSYYRWKKRGVIDREWLLIIKTNSVVFSKLKHRIRSLHSYEVPEVISLKIDDGSRPYLKWLDAELLGTRSGR